MKRKKNIIFIALISLFLSGCFEDEGNYQYEELNPPKWNKNINNELIYVWARGLSDVTLDASKEFTWGKQDAVKRSKEVRYEWTVNGKVISTQLMEKIPTEELMKRIGIEDYPKKALFGNFSIIEKATGIVYKARTYISISPPITDGDFVVYAAKKNIPNKGALSTLVLDYKKSADGSATENFKFQKIVSEDFEGTPKELTIAQALNVGATGSVTAITKEGGAVVFNASNLKKAWDLKEQFDGGVPNNFLVSARRDQEVSSTQPAFTWVATKDGRVFTRQTGKNYLGGKILSEPYYLDEKGYKITKFGHTLWGITNIPCYDEKNRRIVVATSIPHYETNTYRSFMTTLANPNRQGMPVSNIPENYTIFNISSRISGLGWYADRNNSWYEIFYNNQNGTACVGTFAVDNRYRRLASSFADQHWNAIRGYSFTDETVFLISACTRYSRSLKPLYHLFTDNTKIIAVVRNSNYMIKSIEVKELPFEGIESKITCMTYDRGGDVDYRHLLVGCENGDILIYNVKNLPAPILVKKYNVGGRVAAIKQIGVNRATLDLF